MEKLKKIPEGNPFRVPEGYFDEVKSKIISATSDEPAIVRKLTIYQRIRPYMIAAASVAGFILLSYTGFRLISTYSNSRHLSRIMKEENLVPYLNDLDIYSIEQNAASVTVPDQGPDVSKAEIINYLLYDNIEIDEIYEQL